MTDIFNLSVKQLSDALSKKELKPSEVTYAYLDNIEKTDGEIGSFLTVTKAHAIEQAKNFDKLCVLPNILSGIPYSLKDNICTKGILTTCASKMLGSFVPSYSAFVYDKLKESGAVLLGKTNMDEFGMGSSTENSAFKITKNPLDKSLVPGGSSGGSAASVAARLCAFSLGSDTGGSVRQPAAYCGLVGLKPTYGAVSRRGLVAFASSLDTIGPITKNIYDNALVFSQIAKHDQFDSTSVKNDAYFDCLSEIQSGVNGLVVGIVRQIIDDICDKDIKEATIRAIKQYESLGVKIEEISLPALKYALPAYYIISSAEASSNLSRYDGVRFTQRATSFSDIDSLYTNTRSEFFGSQTKRRIMLGTFALSQGFYDEFYKKALYARQLLTKEFNAAFEKCSFLLFPVTPTPAYKIASKTQKSLDMYLGDTYTVPANLCGIPALCLPCGKTCDGKAIGIQLIGKAFDEKTLYKAAFAFEESTKGGLL